MNGTSPIAAPGWQAIQERALPRASEPMELDPQIRLICPVGGLIMFSNALQCSQHRGEDQIQHRLEVPSKGV